MKKVSIFYEITYLKGVLPYNGKKIRQKLCEPVHAILVLLAWAGNDDSGDTAHMRSLARAITARINIKGM